MSASLVLVVSLHENPQAVVDSLEQAGHRAIAAQGETEGLRALFQNQPDAVIVATAALDDRTLALVRRIRELSELPVVVLARELGRGETELAAHGAVSLLVGAVAPTTLGERLESLVATSGSLSERTQEEPQVYEVGNLRVDIRNRRVSRGRRLVNLTPTEFRLLACLLEAGGRGVSHEDILRSVWGSSYHRDRHLVKLYVYYLRRKIERDPAKPRWIRTVHGVGYAIQMDG